MKKHRYTNKNEPPVPRFKKGQHVWFIKNDRNNGGDITETEIRDVSVRWVDYGFTNTDIPSFLSEEKKKEWVEERAPHWEIRYRHKLCLFAQRTVQHSLNEEECYPTIEDATKASFLKFQESVRHFLSIHKKRFNKLGLDIKIQGLLDNSKKEK